jgi:hypothetical protein
MVQRIPLDAPIPVVVHVPTCLALVPTAIAQDHRLHSTLVTKNRTETIHKSKMSEGQALCAVKALEDAGAQLTPVSAAAYALGFIAGAEHTSNGVGMTLTSLLDTTATTKLLEEGGVETPTAVEKAILFAEVSCCIRACSCGCGGVVVWCRMTHKHAPILSHPTPRRAPHVHLMLHAWFTLLNVTSFTRYGEQVASCLF